MSQIELHFFEFSQTMSRSSSTYALFLHQCNFRTMYTMYCVLGKINYMNLCGNARPSREITCFSPSYINHWWQSNNTHHAVSWQLYICWVNKLPYLFFVQQENWPLSFCKRPGPLWSKNLFRSLRYWHWNLVLSELWNLRSTSVFPIAPFSWFSPLYSSCCAGAKPRNFALHARSRKLVQPPPEQ